MISRVVLSRNVLLVLKKQIRLTMTTNMHNIIIAVIIWVLLLSHTKILKIVLIRAKGSICCILYVLYESPFIFSLKVWAISQYSLLSHPDCLKRATFSPVNVNSNIIVRTVTRMIRVWVNKVLINYLWQK